LQHCTLNERNASTLLGKHYQQQVISQLYKVIGSLDLLGNPVSYFSHLSTGVEDFFYEPARGLVRSPKEFAVGFGKGTASLLKNTVGGLFEGVSRMTSSVGKGLAEVTFDREFQEQRQEEGLNKPKNVFHGVGSGLATFAKGIGSGLAGVVTKPVQGAKEDGAKGFFKGIGVGAIGVVTKPVVGLFDGASKVAAGISNTTTMFDKKYIVERKRYPRFIESDRVLRGYSQWKSEGAHILRELEKDLDSEDVYIFHAEYDNEDKTKENEKKLYHDHQSHHHLLS
jgi:vacuolar protein sorting-associated protein 13A/C